MVEVLVDPAPDLSAGGEEGEVGYAQMQHATQSHTNDIPFSPTHTNALTLTSFPAVHLSQYVASLSHRYLGNYLISLDDDGPSFDMVIMSVCNLQCRQDVARVSCLHSRVHQF